VKIQTPFDHYQDRVRPEWTDHNQHLNVGYYVLVFDFATDDFLDYVGLDTAHRQAAKITTFCLEGHITYQREVREAEPLRFTTQLLDFDEKRIHYLHKMYHAQEGYLAATNELISLHVSEATRRAAPMPPEIIAWLAQLQEAHHTLGRPAEVGRVMGLGAGPTTPSSAR
jgi:acyl-CoA thioester hydrolase